MKKLFKDGDIKDVYAYENEAMEIKHETTEALQPIIDKWVDDDYSPHEITTIMVNVITSLMARKIVYDVRKGRKPTKPKPTQITIGTNTFYKRIFSGTCMCGHSYEDHHLGLVGDPRIAEVIGPHVPDQCDFFGFNEHAGLDEDGNTHCHNYVDREDPNPAIIADWKGTVR